MENLIIIIWSAPLAIYMLYWAFWYTVFSKEDEIHPFGLSNEEAELFIIQLATWPIIVFAILCFAPFIIPFVILKTIKKKRIKNASSGSRKT